MAMSTPNGIDTIRGNGATPLRIDLLIGISALSLLGPAGCRGIIDRDANRLFMQELGSTSITVFPAYVRRAKGGEYDTGAAARIGELVSGDRLADLTIIGRRVPITGSWHSNQARMLRESAADFSAYLKDHPIDTAYALLAEYLIGGSGSVGGIHCYILDAKGNVAWAGLWNSHHKAFAEANLKTADDCTSLLVAELRQRLRPR